MRENESMLPLQAGVPFFGRRKGKEAKWSYELLLIQGHSTTEVSLIYEGAFLSLHHHCRCIFNLNEMGLNEIFPPPPSPLPLLYRV